MTKPTNKNQGKTRNGDRKENLTPEAYGLIRDLREFTGDDVRFKSSLRPNVVFTPGVQHLAEAANAYWLIDAIASWIGSNRFNQAVENDDQIRSLHFWSFELTEDGGGVLEANRVSTEPPFAPIAFITQKVAFTDFPLPEINLWCGHDGRVWTLYLPSEH